MSDHPSGPEGSPGASPAFPAQPSGKRAGGAKKLLLTFIKIAIAVVALWFVCRGVSWYDNGRLPAGTEINAVKFLDTIEVRVLAQAPPPDAVRNPAVPATARGSQVRIAFPETPVRVEVDGHEYSLVIDQDTPVPDHGTLGLAHEKEIPLFYLADVKGQRVQEGLRTLFIQASGKWYLLVFAWALLGVPFLVTAIRWRNLMRPQGIDMPLAKCLQLTFVGQFYSIILPGITGGDLVKIVYAARLTGSKTKSFITIILDRVIGLVALMVIAGTSAGVQLYLNSRQAAAIPAATLATATQPLTHAAEMQTTLLNVFVLIVIMLGVLAVGSTVYFSRRLRKLLGITWFIENFGSLSDPSEGIQRAEHERLEHLFRILNGMLLAVSLVGIAALAGLRWGTTSAWARHNTPAIVVGIGLLAGAALVAAGALAMHRRLVDRATPLMGKVVQLIIGVDETLHVYRGHFGLLAWAFFISVISQLTLPLSAWLSGMAFGMNAPATYYMAYVPLAILAASLPISPPQGAGFLEIVLNQFFVNKGTATASQAFALTQSVRFLPILWNLCGAYWVVTGKYSRKNDTSTK